MSDTVIRETRGAVALLTLNRPEKLNALSYPLIDRLMALLDEIERAPEVRAVVLTGAGERAFSAGADIAGFAPSVAAGPEAALVPANGPERRAVQRLVAIGLGLAEKSVEYRTETFRRAADKQEPELAARLALQIEAALGWLEPRAEKTWLHGDRLTQADITAAVAVTNLLGKIPAFMPAGRYPNLEALTDRAEALDCFQAAPFSEN